MSRYTLYAHRNSYAMTTHLLLEELAVEYDIVWFNVHQQDQFPPEFLNLNKTVEGVMGLGTWSPNFKTYQNDIFVKLFREKYGHDPYGHNVWAMASIQVMLRAIQLAGSLDPQKIRQALLTNDFPTVMGVFHFQENGLPPADEQAAYLFQVQNGVPVCVWPKKMATAKPIWPLPSG